MTAKPIIIGRSSLAAMTDAGTDRNAKSQHSQIDDQQHAKKNGKREYVGRFNPWVEIVRLVQGGTGRLGVQ